MWEYKFYNKKHEHYARKFRIDVRLLRPYNNTRTLYFDRHRSIQGLYLVISQNWSKIRNLGREARSYTVPMTQSEQRKDV